LNSDEWRERIKLNTPASLMTRITALMTLVMIVLLTMMMSLNAGWCRSV
jgi:hypothetical protein